MKLPKQKLRKVFVSRFFSVENVASALDGWIDVAVNFNISIRSTNKEE